MSGKTKDKAVKELEKHLKKDRETKVTLKVQKKSVEVTLDELGLCDRRLLQRDGFLAV